MAKLTKHQQKILDLLKSDPDMIIQQNLYTLIPTVTDQKPGGVKYKFKASTLKALFDKGLVEPMMDYKWRLVKQKGE